MQIYLARNHQQAGPYSLEQLNQMLASQQVLLTDLIWHVGMATWLPVGEVTQGKTNYQPPLIQHPTSQSNTASQNQPSLEKNSQQKQSTNDKNTIQLASINKRILAKIIDMSLWLPAFLCLTAFMTTEQQQKLAQLQAQGMLPTPEHQIQLFSLIPSVGWMSMLIYIAVMLFIQSQLIAKTGQSIGKKVLDIQIVAAENHKITSVWKAFYLRSLLFIILHIVAMPFSLVIDWAFIHGQRKQTLHDRIAKTVVIDKKS